MRELSELEGAVMGLVWSYAPCTAYNVRTYFLRSPSPYWSGSAGAVYPLLDRLTRLKLVRTERRYTGRRLAREYSLTPRGLAELRRWTAGISQRTAGVPMDPLRVRIRFLAALPPNRRTALLKEARSKVAAHLRAVALDCRVHRASGDTFSYLTARGSLLTLRARLNWLGEVARLSAKRAR